MHTIPAAEPKPSNGIPRPVSPPFGPITADLEQVERQFASVLAGYRPPITPLIHHLRHYRGKRLRPALLLLTARACGEATPAHHTLATVVEMIHTATLVHDDVLDEADTRRHAPTVNAEWGNKVGILFGDMLFSHAFTLACTVDLRACRLVGDAATRVCAGELRQVAERGNLHLSEADYFTIIDGKTAALTEVCGRLGALYAGASEATAERMASFGRNLGLAFQVADDLLDLTGDEQKTGKTLGTDLEQQKLTLPLIHALGKLPPAEADRLREGLRSGAGTPREQVAAALEAAGALTYARRRAEEFARHARADLECLPRSEARTILEQVTDWSVRRDK